MVCPMNGRAAKARTGCRGMIRLERPCLCERGREKVDTFVTQPDAVIIRRQISNTSANNGPGAHVYPILPTTLDWSTHHVDIVNGLADNPCPRGTSELVSDSGRLAQIDAESKGMGGAISGLQQVSDCQRLAQCVGRREISARHFAQNPSIGAREHLESDLPLLRRFHLGLRFHEPEKRVLRPVDGAGSAVGNLDGSSFWEGVKHAFSCTVCLPAGQAAHP